MIHAPTREGGPLSSGPAASNPDPGQLRSSRRQRWLFAGIGVLAAAFLVALALWMTGPAPKPVGGEAEGDPPPLVLRQVPPASPDLRRAAAALGDGRLALAERRFTDVVAQRPDDVQAQLGLVLSRWRDLGPSAVERDLEQLRREYPGDPSVTMHLALARTLGGDAAAGQTLLATARREALEAEPPALDLARRADDLGHPELAPGYPPLLVPASSLKAREARRLLDRIVGAVARDDRELAAEAAARSRAWEGDAADARLLGVAAAVAEWDKDAPRRGVRALERVAAAAPRPSDARAAAELHRGLLLLWAADRRAGMRAIEDLASETGRTTWHRQARVLERRLG